MGVVLSPVLFDRYRPRIRLIFNAFRIEWQHVADPGRSAKGNHRPETTQCLKSIFWSSMTIKTF
jgi:hypothetical protein